MNNNIKNKEIKIYMDFFTKYFEEIQTKVKINNKDAKKITNDLIEKTLINLQDDRANDFLNNLLIGLHEASHLITAIYNPFYHLDFDDIAAKIIGYDEQKIGISFIMGIIENITPQVEIALSEAILISVGASIILEQYLFKTNTSAVDNDKKEIQELWLEIVQKTNKSKNAYRQITRNLIKKNRLKIFLIGLYLANYYYITKKMLFKLCKEI